MPKFLPTILFICLTAPTLFAQHIDIDKKALSFLSSEKRVNVVFTYENLVFDGDDVPEAEFLQKRYVDVSEWKDKKSAKEWLVL